MHRHKSLTSTKRRLWSEILSSNPLDPRRVWVSDTNSIATLLDQLSSSTAWQQAVSTQTVKVQPASTPVPSKEEETSSKLTRVDESTQLMDEDELPVKTPSGRVGALLDLLGSTTTPPNCLKSEIVPGDHDRLSSLMKIADPPEGNLRHASFAEALQAVTKLAQKPTVIRHLKEIRDEQNRLEQRYWESRQQILQKQRDRIEELNTKVSITGKLGSREVERLKASFHKELVELEQEEFLPAWDKLLTRQQSTLDRMNVPLMFETSDPDERRKQQQIVNVLEGLMDGSS